MYASAQKTESPATQNSPIHMNRERARGIGRQFIGRLKQRWGKFSGDAGAVTAGARDRLAGRIQEQRGASKERSERQLEDFLQRNRNWWNLPGR
jgi:uncharacterized protein YjbJ (UPF0337 family)